MIGRIRRFLWRVLGVDYEHMMRVVDHVYVSESEVAQLNSHSYNNHAKIYTWGDGELSVGKYCSISYDVRFILDDGSHQYNLISNYPFKSNEIGPKKGIKIGNDVWIGMGSIILPGVEIGDGATIAAGSVVSRDIEPYTLVGGIPARFIREKCSREQANQMQQIAWWNWPDRIVEQRTDDFKLNFSDFIAKYSVKTK